MDQPALIYGVSAALAFGALGASVLHKSAAPWPGESGPAFVNWETPHVHPLDITPDRTRLLAVNTADNRLEVFRIITGTPDPVASIPVGLDPVSVRARTNTEAWVVNHISDSVSVVDLSTGAVVATLTTLDEPADVVFAGNPQRAFVTCSQANTIQVFNPANLAAAPINIPIDGEDPRALAVSKDGSRIFAAVFESGNATTILGGGATVPTNQISFPPNVVTLATGPWGGLNPPPNSGSVFSPPKAAGLPTPPRVGLIVKKDNAGQWKDDNNGNWTSLVSGPQAAQSGRAVGWDMPDRDIAIIHAGTLAVTYATGLMNIGMAIAVNPGTGRVTLVGTDATNQVRFEPNIKGRFLRVQLAVVHPTNPASKTIKDLNPHLTYTTPTLPSQTDRNRGVGDPRAIAWNAAGTTGYIAGMGSNNLLVIDAAGNRVGNGAPINVGEGPTGLALDEPRSRLFVLNRFESSISVVSTVTRAELTRVSFFDPTPSAIRNGRRHLYNTHKTSGLGIASCASCHVDARMDRLAWDLGDPQGAMRPANGLNAGGGVPATGMLQPFHPMKGPTTTQTLQDIIGLEPFHWRGDRFGLEEFNSAFQTLLGDDALLTTQEMQQFEDFLATIHFPPNPFRNFDNTLPTNVPLPGHYTPGRFVAAGQPLPPGNALKGMLLFRNTSRLLANGIHTCAACHTFPTGTGPDSVFSGTQFHAIPPGPNGERHHAVVGVDGVTNITMKTPQLRNLYDKVGFNMTHTSSRAGFGFMHDGAVDSIERFLAEDVFDVGNDQEIADLVAFLLCFSGSDLLEGSTTNFQRPEGSPSRDTHAAVGRQITISSGPSAAQLALIDAMIGLAQAGKIGLVVKGLVMDEPRGFAFIPATGKFQSDRAIQSLTPAALRALAKPGGELTYTVVPRGTETRIGIDRDSDGTLDADEPRPCAVNCDGSTNAAGLPTLTAADLACFQARYALKHPYADCNGDGLFTVVDFGCFQAKYALGCP